MTSFSRFAGTRSSIVFLAVVVLFLPASTYCDTEATTSRNVRGLDEMELETEPIVGGWSPVTDFENPPVPEAADFAFQELTSASSSYSITEDPEKSGDVAGFEVVGASQQVVAGLNIRMDMVFTDSSGGCLGAGTVVVYDRFGDMSVTSWELNGSGCPDDEGDSDTTDDAISSVVTKGPAMGGEQSNKLNMLASLLRFDQSWHAH